MKKLCMAIPLVFLFLISGSHWLVANDTTSFQQVEADDADALKGVKVGKVLFDINVKDPLTLYRYLYVIQQTYDDMVRQNVKPDMILAFRGNAVAFISKERERFNAQESEQLDKVAEYIANLIEKGVKIESCAIAMNGRKIKQESLLEGIKTVGNTFISLMGYQIKGYGVIPIY